MNCSNKPSHTAGFILTFLTLGFFILFSGFAQAKSSDIDQALHIEADSVEIRELKGISIYKGHVLISRGSMQLKGQEIYIKTKKNGVYTIEIEGTPAEFKQINDAEQKISAQSQKMSFSSTSGILVLDNDAVLIQGQNKFTSEHIVYNTLNDSVQAGLTKNKSDIKESQRVSITIQPNKTKNPISD